MDNTSGEQTGADPSGPAEPRKLKTRLADGYADRRPWGERLAGFALLAPAVALCALLWREPPPAHLTLGATMIDTMLLPATFLVVLSALAILIGTWPISRLAAQLGSALGVALGISMWFAFGHHPLDYVGVAVAVGTVVSSALLLYWCISRSVSSLELRWRHIAVLGSAVIALLPIMQFWHTSSFVPSHLGTTVGATVSTDFASFAGSTRGTAKLSITNGGGVGAVIVGSELITCYRTGLEPGKRLDELYNDPDCDNTQLFDHLSTLDANSTWTLNIAIRSPNSNARLVEITIALWYAREDRLKVEPVDITFGGQEDEDTSACSKTLEKLTFAWVESDSRTQAVVQRPRRLVYLREGGGGGDDYFGLQAEGQDVCYASGQEAGHPTHDQSIGDDVGLSQLIWTYQAWVPSS